MDKNTPALWCDECHGLVALDEEHAFYQRGEWWCRKHVVTYRFDGKTYVDFPSPGKLMPRTIQSDETPYW